MSIADRGFASLIRSNPDRQRAIAQAGGRAAHVLGRAHTWTSAEAREAGRKGGLASHARRQAVSAPATPSTETAPAPVV